jgi:glycosyltransferase involved in cell wall biosynthesis
VSDYLRAADVFVLPSKEEGLSRALVEAMAAGLPAIVSDLPGHDGIVVDGETGMSVRPGDEDQLAEAIRYLAADRAFRVALGRGARNLATREFSLSTSVARHVAAYRRVTAAEGEPTAGV